MLLRRLVTVWASLALLAASVHGQSYREARERLVREDLERDGIVHKDVLKAMRSTPRHEFVPRDQRRLAYFDMALPIGAQQTISSPYIVAFMTQALDPQPSDRVLEIGTGSGYQAAVLSPLVKKVYSIEIIPELGRSARRTLRKLGYRNIETKIGDGYQGWEEEAPFDKIIVTCSPRDVPQPLVKQLREGGYMVVPVGERYQQTLYRFTKEKDSLKQEALLSTLFVPMTGIAEQSDTPSRNFPELQIINGSFEDIPTEDAPLPGWYYTRQGRTVDDESAPDGKQVAEFMSETPGRSAHSLQGIGIDGQKFTKVILSAWIQVNDVEQGTDATMLPRVMISFFDDQRAPIGDEWLGPWQGSIDWTQTRREIRVPAKAKEAIVRCGLFGATGTFRVDAIRVEAGSGSGNPRPTRASKRPR